MKVRNEIIEAYTQWTRAARPSCWRDQIGADVYGTLSGVDFEILLDDQRGPIARPEFDEWHRSNTEATMLREARLQVRWASKMLNVYLKTRAYIAAQGRAGWPTSCTLPSMLASGSDCAASSAPDPTSSRKQLRREHQGHPRVLVLRENHRRLSYGSCGT